MAIKSEIQPSPARKAVVYPLLMQGKESGVVVLMDAHACGTIVAGKSKQGYGVGRYCNNWTMTSFDPFTGIVSSSNEAA